jgi:5-methylcytosine-specific restriction endonuclease McrA
MMWYLRTWLWAVILAPAAALLYALTGLNIVACAAIVVALLVLLRATRKRPVITAPPPRMLSRREAYADYISSAAWRAKRQQRLAIDRHQCQDCGGSWDLEVHHLTYERFQHELMADLVTLCDHCHHLRHSRQRRHAHR